jgi:hypothetical protein
VGLSRTAKFRQTSPLPASALLLCCRFESAAPVGAALDAVTCGSRQRNIETTQNKPKIFDNANRLTSA